MTLSTLPVRYNENRERSGSRDMTMSGWAREAGESMRHLDLDLMQKCPRCDLPYLFIEDTSTRGFKSTTTTRAVAKACGGWAILIRHGWNDTHGVKPIQVTVWDRQGDPLSYLNEKSLTKPQLLSLLAKFQEMHDNEVHNDRM